MSDLQIVSVRLPCLCEVTEQMLVPFICSVGYKGHTKHTNIWLASAMEHTNGYQCQPSCCCTCHVNKMIRLACLIDISMLLQGGLERRGCVVGQKQSVAAEKCVL